MKKALISILILLFVLVLPITFASTEYVPLVLSNGQNVYYRQNAEHPKNDPVMIPTTYNTPERDFRGVWVSPLVSDVRTYIDKESYQSELLSILDTMEKYRLNTIIYHIRIMNDALYDTELSPKSSYVSRLDFEEWDYLEWFIDEVHRRGMEFHAWLNPYRIQNGQASAETVAKRYSNYPQNPASNPENILVGDSTVILNPGEPAVRDFLVDVCMEVIEKYDVDAIHFDDYFYIAMDQSTDLKTYNKYKHNSNTTNIEDWRREQVDLFIYDLSKSIRRYNLANDRRVQLGISPSGIWDNGDGIVHGYDENGNAITNGSNTAGFSHYDYYLYSDTKKWIDNEWIDYILPQVYWAFTQPVAPYADIVDWWAKVVKYKDVNLYIGMGLYMSESSSTYSWYSEPYESANQILYNSKHPEVDGISIFSFKNLRSNRNKQGLNKILDEYWTNPALTPRISIQKAITPEDVSDVNIVKNESGFTLSWDPATNARRYAIYRNETTVNINNPKHLVGVVGYNPTLDKVVFNDIVDNTKDYNYVVVSVSASNTLSEGYTLDTTNLDEHVEFPIASLDDIYFTGKLLPNRTYQLRFKEGIVYAGSSLTYEVYYSYDQENWIKIDQQPSKSGNTYYLSYTYPNSIAPFYYKVIAKNEFGEIESNILMANPSPEGFSGYMDLVFEIITDRIAKVFPSGS